MSDSSIWVECHLIKSDDRKALIWKAHRSKKKIYSSKSFKINLVRTYLGGVDSSPVKVQDFFFLNYFIVGIKELKW